VFPGATAERETAAYALLGAPLDVSTTFQPGTRFGPDRVRRFGAGFEDYDHHSDQLFTELGVYDAGNEYAWDDAPAYLEQLTARLRSLVESALTPILIGGEHTVSVAAFRALSPDVVVSIDAHLDLREEFDGNEYSHATVGRHALDVADHLLVLGARAGSRAAWRRASEADVTVVPPAELASWAPDTDPALQGEPDLYCTVDIDAISAGLAPGTGTPEPFGVTPRELQRVIRALAPRACGFDLVEVNDRDDGQAAVIGAKLVREFVFAHASAR
jgi:agmatinase